MQLKAQLYYRLGDYGAAIKIYHELFNQHKVRTWKSLRKGQTHVPKNSKERADSHDRAPLLLEHWKYDTSSV